MLEFCRCCCKELSIPETMLTLKICGDCRAKLTPAECIRMELTAELLDQAKRFNSLVEENRMREES